MYQTDLPSLQYLDASVTGDYYAPLQFVETITIISIPVCEFIIRCFQYKGTR